jgi:hypothetical protein
MLAESLLVAPMHQTHISSTGLSVRNVSASTSLALVAVSYEMLATTFFAERYSGNVMDGQTRGFEEKPLKAGVESSLMAGN